MNLKKLVGTTLISTLAACGGGGVETTNGVPTTPPSTPITSVIPGSYNTATQLTNGFKAASFLLDKDGAVLIAGENCLIAKYDVNKNLDKTFNSSGFIKLPSIQSNDTNCKITDIKQSNDGNYLIVAINYLGIILHKLNTNGMIDPKFGNYNGFSFWDFADRLWVNGKDLGYPKIYLSNNDILIYGSYGKYYSYGNKSVQSGGLYTVPVKNDGQIDSIKFTRFNPSDTSIPVGYFPAYDNFRFEITRLNDGTYITPLLNQGTITAVNYDSNGKLILSNKGIYIQNGNTGTNVSNILFSTNFQVLKGDASCGGVIIAFSCPPEYLDPKLFGSLPLQIKQLRDGNIIESVVLNGKLAFAKFDINGNIFKNFGINGVANDSFYTGDYFIIELPDNSILFIAKSLNDIKYQNYNINGQKIQNLKINGSTFIPPTVNIIGASINNGNRVLIYLDNFQIIELFI